MKKSLRFDGQFGMDPGNNCTPEVTFTGSKDIMDLLDKVLMKRKIVSFREYTFNKSMSLRFHINDIIGTPEVLRFDEMFEGEFIIKPDDNKTPQLKFSGSRAIMALLDKVFLARGIVSTKERFFCCDDIWTLRFDVDDDVVK